MSNNAAPIKSQQAVAQSTSIAVQDAADYLRNLSTITSTAIGVALAQLLATGDPKYSKVIEEAQKVMEKAAEHFSSVGEKAAKIQKDFSP
jgi:TPR repeat protein